MKIKDKYVECERTDTGEIVCKIMDSKKEVELGSFSMTPTEKGYEIQKFSGSPSMIEDLAHWVVKNLKFK